jgi:glutamate synthase domain-containing protein 3
MQKKYSEVKVCLDCKKKFTAKLSQKRCYPCGEKHDRKVIDDWEIANRKKMLIYYRDYKRMYRRKKKQERLMQKQNETT